MTAIDREERWLWIRVGAQEGAKLGALWAVRWLCIPLVLALVGVLFSVAFELYKSTHGGQLNPELTLPNVLLAVLMLLVFEGIFIAVGGVVGVFPAMLIGAATGAFMGAVLGLSHIAPYRWNRLAVGGGVALLAVLSVNIPVLNLDVYHNTEFHAPYLYVLGLPSLIYFAAALHLSKRLPLWVEQARQRREFPVRLH